MKYRTKDDMKVVECTEDWSTQIENLSGGFHGLYDDHEIIEALELQKKIINGVKQMNRICFEIIQNLWEFISSKFYLNLGCKNVKDWITSWGGAPSTFYRYLAIYRLFTVENEIPIAEYEYVDITKLNAMMPLAKYADNVDDIKKLIIDADEMVLCDCSEIVREELRKRQVISSDPSAPDEKFFDDVEGSYKLVKLTNEEERNVNIKSMKILKNSLIKKAILYYSDGELQYLRVEG